MKTRNIITLFFSLFIFLNCSKDTNIVENNTDEESESTPVIIDLDKSFTNLEVVNFVIETISLNSDKYQGIIDDIEIEVTKTSDNELSFLVPNSIEGSQQLTIYSLNNLIVKFDIEKLELVDTPENIIKDITNKTTSFTTNSPEETQIKTLFDTFNKEIVIASDEEKQYFASLYSANKELFDGIFVSTSAKTNLVNNGFKNLNEDWEARNQELLTSYTSDILVMKVAIVVAVTSNTTFPLVTSIAAGIAIGYFKTAKRSYEEFMLYNVSILDFAIVNITNDLNKSTINSKTTNRIMSNEDESKAIQIEYDIRKVNESDLLSSIIGFKTLGSAINIANEKINSLNEKIRWVNNKLDLSVDEIDLFELEKDTNVITQNVNTEIYKYFEFSVSNSNVKIKSIHGTSSGVNVLFEIDENYKETLEKDTNEDGKKDITEVEINLNYTYTSHFNSKQGSIPLTILLKDCNGVYGGEAYISECDICVEGNTGKTEEEECNNPFIGSWTAISFNGGNSMGEIQKYGFISECNVYTEQGTINSATADITKSNISVNISQETGSSGYASSGGEVDCESIYIEFDNANFTINDTYTVKTNSTNADLDTEIDCEGEGNNISTLTISGNKLIFKYCELTLTFEK